MLALTEDEGVGEEDEFSFFLSFSMCFSSRAAILSPLPLRVFLSRTAWASLRLSDTKHIDCIHEDDRPWTSPSCPPCHWENVG